MEKKSWDCIASRVQTQETSTTRGSRLLPSSLGCSWGQQGRSVASRRWPSSEKVCSSWTSISEVASLPGHSAPLGHLTGKHTVRQVVTLHKLFILTVFYLCTSIQHKLMNLRRQFSILFITYKPTKFLSLMSCKHNPVTYFVCCTAVASMSPPLFWKLCCPVWEWDTSHWCCLESRSAACSRRTWWRSCSGWCRCCRQTRFCCWGRRSSASPTGWRRRR